MTVQVKNGANDWIPKRLESLKGKTYVITGANAGAGFEAARVFLSKGAKVVMMNRNADKSASAISDLKKELGKDADVTFVRMDLAVLDSVREAAADVLKQNNKIDALICNTAIAQVATREMTVDGFENQFGVNHLGHFLLSALLFERLEESNGRSVVVGSNGYKMGAKRIEFEDINYDEKYSPWNAYAQSKLAPMMFGYELQRRIEEKGSSVRVYVCHPGAARTNLMKGKASKGMKFLWALMSSFVQTAEKGSWPEVMCATAEGLEPQKFYGPTRFEMVGSIGECKLEDFALDKEMAAKLWTFSEEKTSLSWSP